MARDYLRRASVLVVCGGTVDEAMKNDIAVAERLRITATTLDGIDVYKRQGGMSGVGRCVRQIRRSLPRAIGPMRHFGFAPEQSQAR